MSAHATDSPENLQTAVMTVVRNEMDVLPMWLAHTRALVDHIYIVDHLSEDGTLEYLRAWSAEDPNVRVYTYRDHGYDKPRIIRTLRFLILEETAADWLLQLDPDEFLPHVSRAEFHGAIRDRHVGEMVRYRWRNALPVAPGPIHESTRLRCQKRPGGLGKIVISRAIASEPSIDLPRGAHTIWHRERGKLAPIDGGELIHIPFRSLEQAWAKAIRGVLIALRVNQSGLEGVINWQYASLLDHLAEKPHWDTVLRLVLNYGERDRKGWVRSDRAEGEIAAEFEPRSLPVAAEVPDSLWPTGQSVSRATTVPFEQLRGKEPYRSFLTELLALNHDNRIGLSDRFEARW